MKKIRKHFMILFLFLLFGVTLLSLSSNGAFASVFGWLQSAPAESAASSRTAASKTASTQKTAMQAEPQDAAANLFVSPINARKSIKHAVSMDAAEDSAAGDDSDAVGGYSSPLTGTVNWSGSEHSATGPADSPATIAPGDPVEDTAGNNGSASAPTVPHPGDSPSSPGNTPGSNDGGNTGGNIVFPGGNHSGGHHRRTVSITGVTLDKADLALLKGENATLSATVTPSNTTQDKTVTWSSSDDSIVTVDKAGKVAAVKGGTATITAKASNGKTAACNVTVSIPATGVSLSLSDTPVERGQTLQLTSKLTPEDSTDKVLWATSDSNIATVDSSGNVTGVAPGTAYVIAAVGDGSISASCRITTVVSISKLVLSDETLTIKKGEEHQLTAQVLPEDTTEDKTVAWSSSDPTAATVDDTGKIAAVEGGTAIITAQTGTHSAQCTVTVTVPVTGITLDKTELTLARGTTGVLVPTISPSDATDTAVDWTSSNETVATVDGSGKITAVTAGTATITGTTHDGGFAAQCAVTVIVPVTGVTLDKTTLDLKKGDTASLTAAIAPADATDQAVSWTTSDPKVVTVDESGRITATGGGMATVTVTTHGGGFAASCGVTVTVPVKGVSLNKSSLLLIKGASETLKPVFDPADATDQAVTWASSDPKVATVDTTGKVTSISTGGTATITVTTHDGSFTASCQVSTAIPVTGIKLDKTSLTVTRGNSKTLTTTIAPANATDKTVIWSSSKPSVATVSASGEVYARGSGSATITAKTRDGAYTATCQVTAVAAVQAKLEQENSDKAGFITSYGSGKILVRDNNGSGHTYRHSYIDFTFAEPVTYQATNKYDYYDHTSPAQSLIQFVNADSDSGFGATASITLYDMDHNKEIAYQGKHDPWFVDIKRNGIMINSSGQATHFRLKLYSELFATGSSADEAYLSWDKIIFCGVQLTDIQVLS